MSSFCVCGPHDFPLEKSRAQKTTAADVSEFWDMTGTADERGCYVFAMRTPKGYTPIYVGKTHRTFKQECFAPHKRYHYNRALREYRRGTPQMFFVVQTRTRGKPNDTDIWRVERFLIQNAVVRNPNLANVAGTKQANWRIDGVIRSERGKPTTSALEFRKLMDF